MPNQQMHDPATDRPLFVTRCIELCCEKCKEEGRQAECNHLLHLVPSWQSEERHRKLKVMMQDRPVCYVHIVFLVCQRRHTGPTVALARRTECTGPWCWGSSWRLTCPCARCCLCQCRFFLTQIALNFIFFPGFDPVRIGGTGVRLFTTGVPQARHREHVCAGAAAA